MQKKIIKKIVVTLMILLLMLITTNINVKAATDSYNMGIITNKSTIEEGDSLEITLSLKDINVTTGDKGIGAYQATLEYDKNIFEYVSIEGLNSWDTPIYNNGTFATTTKTGEVIKDNEYVAKITLKVKSNISVENTTIKVVNITASAGAETISTKDISKKISIKVKNSNNTENTTTNSKNEVTEKENSANKTQDKTSNATTGVSTTNSNTSKSTNDTTTANKIIPKTGVSEIIFYGVIGIAILSIITGIIVYKNKKMFK